MKKRLFVALQLLLALGGLIISTPASAVVKDVNNFYFESYDVNYYVSKAEDGTPRMRVVEKVTAVFPDYNQNKGICREIARLNDGDKMIVLEDLDESKITLTRNGLPEPIYSIENGGQAYKICTGNNDYLTGKQEYEFRYEFMDVVTQFSEDEETWQEIYWDTNGTESKQPFNKVKATIHFEDPEVMTGDFKCYVGIYGSHNAKRCITLKNEDGFTFVAAELRAGENLSFEVKLKENSFVIREPRKNYILVFVAIGVGVLCLIFVLFALKKFRKTAENRRYYKGLFISPEYTPHKDYSLLEMAGIYIGGTKKPAVALMLAMLAEKKIELKKDGTTFFGKQKWAILVKKRDALSEPEKTLLRILNGGPEFADGAEIKIRAHTATTTLVSLGRKLDKFGPDQAKKDGLVDSKFTSAKGNVGSSTILAVIIIIFSFCPMVFVPIFAAIVILRDLPSGELYSNGYWLVHAKPMVWTMIATVLLTIVINTILRHRAARVEHYTKKGLEASRYMDGLKLYIKMAEADRIKFLQSVKGADTSKEGIVNIYEKLLPYAALFGLEKSWMKEFENFCDFNEVSKPDWYQVNNIVAFSAISSSLHSASTYVASSTHYQSSGGSGFSGGGGGGFSGGGGGGGGFSGR